MKRGIATVVLTGCGLSAVGLGPSADGGPTPDSTSVTDGGVTVLPDGAIILEDGAVVVDAGPPTCDASLATDPDNCGSCGRSCVGGTCEAGACSIVTVVSNEKEPQGLAVDNANVYWTNTGAAGDIESCPLTGCTTAGGTVLASNLASPNAIVSAGGFAYWTNYAGNTLQRCAVGGCAQAPTTVATMSPVSLGFGRLAADATTVYFTDAGNQKVHSCPIAGCGGGPATLATTQNNPWGIAVDDTHVFWVNDVATTGSVESCPKTGCGASNTLKVTLATNQSSARSIAIDATHVYWATQLGGTIMRCAKTGCNDQPQTLVSTLQNPHGVAVDDAFVYFTERTTNMVKKVPKAGGATVLVAGAQNNPFSIVVDQKAIYWTNWVVGVGAVMKVAK